MFDDSKLTPGGSADGDVEPFDYVLPVRIDHPSRLTNLHKVLRWLRLIDAARPIVVEQDASRHIEAEVAKGRLRYRFDRFEGAFNKSRAMNQGFALGASDVLVFGDADIVMPPGLLLRAVAACRAGAELINPYQHLVDLSQADSDRLDPAALPRRAESVSGANREGHGEQLCLAGGAFAIRREFFERCGGMDEDFAGWGGEDDAFSIKARRLGRRLLASRGGHALHLWHPRARPPAEDPDYVRNRGRVIDYQRMGAEEFEEMCARHRRSLALTVAAVRGDAPDDNR